METVEVVIEIPKNRYETLVELNDRIKNGESIYKLGIYEKAIANGTVLSKGHGRLGDLDALRKKISSWGMNDYEPSDFIDEIDMADVIIEADEAESEE